MVGIRYIYIYVEVRENFGLQSASLIPLWCSKISKNRKKTCG